MRRFDRSDYYYDHESGKYLPLREESWTDEDYEAACEELSEQLYDLDGEERAANDAYYAAGRGCRVSR